MLANQTLGELTNQQIAEYIFGSLPAKYSKYKANFVQEEFIDGSFLETYQSEFLDDDLLKNDLGIDSPLARIAVKEQIRKLIKRKGAPFPRTPHHDNPPSESPVKRTQFGGGECPPDEIPSYVNRYAYGYNYVEQNQEQSWRKEFNVYNEPLEDEFVYDQSDTEPRTVDSMDFEQQSYEAPPQLTIADARLRSLKFGSPRRPLDMVAGTDQNRGRYFEILKTRIVFRTYHPDSEKIGGLPKGLIVQIVEEIGNRARLDKPFKGWITTSSATQTFIRKYNLDGEQECEEEPIEIKRDPGENAARANIQEEMTMIKTLCKILQNLDKPDPKYKTLHLSNRSLQNRVLRFEEGFNLIHSFGFRETTPGTLEVVQTQTEEVLDMAFDRLQQRLEYLTILHGSSDLYSTC